VHGAVHPDQPVGRLAPGRLVRVEGMRGDRSGTASTLEGRGSVARRLASAMVLTVAGALLLAGAGFVSYSASGLRSELARQSLIVADLVGANCLTALAFDDPGFAHEILATVAADTNVSSACLYAQDGSAYARFSRDGDADPAHCPAPAEAGARYEGDRLHIQRPILVEARTAARIYLEVDTRPLTRRLAQLVGIVALVLVAALIAAFALSHRLRAAIAAPIAELVAHAHRVATGDLSQPVDSDRSDELGRLARAFGAMGRQLGALVGRIRHTTLATSSSVDSLRSASGEIHKDALHQEQAVRSTAGVLSRMGASIARVNESVEGLSIDAEATATSVTQMKASASDVAGRLERLFGAIDTTASSTAQTTANIGSIASSLDALRSSTASTMLAVSRLAEAGEVARASASDNRVLSSRTATTASQGLEVVSQAVTSIEAIQTSFDEIRHAVGLLSSRMESIHAIVEAIEGIASESSLLSLNAQIIAAQAGDSGKGFSVVAQQMKALAGQTTGSAQEIAELIGGVRQAAESAVAAVSRGSERMSTGVERSDEAGRVFRGICEIAEEIQRMGDRIDTSSRDQDAGVEQVQATMAEVESIVSAIDRAVSEQDAASSEIARAAESMRELGLAVRTATGEQALESEQIAAAMVGVKQKVDLILAATREQTADSAGIDSALAVFRESAGAAGRRAAELEGIVADLAERSGELEREIDRFRL
jgi:methyl-accepting chemotaxis protein